MTKDTVEQLLDQPFWIVDILPRQVSAHSAGQYFAVEQFFLQKTNRIELGRKYLHLLLKLNCYYDFSVSFDVGERWEENPAPEVLEDWFLRAVPSDTVHIMIHSEHTMAVLDVNDTYMTVYNPTENLLELVGCIAAAEGLFVWKPEEAIR